MLIHAAGDEPNLAHTAPGSEQGHGCCRYELFGARYVVVSDPKVLPKLLDSEKFTMDAHSAAVAGSLSKEAHIALAPAFTTEGAKSVSRPSDE